MQLKHNTAEMIRACGMDRNPTLIMEARPEGNLYGWHRGDSKRNGMGRRLQAIGETGGEDLGCEA